MNNLFKYYAQNQCSLGPCYCFVSKITSRISIIYCSEKSTLSNLSERGPKSSILHINCYGTWTQIIHTSHQLPSNINTNHPTSHQLPPNVDSNHPYFTSIATERGPKSSILQINCHGTWTQIIHTSHQLPSNVDPNHPYFTSIAIERGHKSCILHINCHGTWTQIIHTSHQLPLNVDTKHPTSHQLPPNVDPNHPFFTSITTERGPKPSYSNHLPPNVDPNHPYFT
jgi:hypothetical protein